MGPSVPLGSRRLTVVLFAVAASLLLSVSPMAGAANAVPNLDAASEHTTASDFQSADTLENLTVEGSGPSASVALGETMAGEAYSFEHGNDPASEGWTEAPGDHWEVTNSADAQDGSHYLNSHNNDNKQWTMATRGDRDDVHVRGWIKDSYGATGSQSYPGLVLGANNGEGYIAWITPKSDELIIGTLDTADGSQGSHTALDSTSVTVDEETWYWLSFEREGDQLTATVYDDEPSSGGTQLAQTSVTDSTYGSGGFGAAAFRPDARVDELTVGSPTQVESGQYVGSPHAAEGVEEGWVNLSLSNATADVTWKGYDGNQWQPVVSDTYSTTGNRTLALSGDYDQWRMDTEFETTGDDATVELHDEGVLFDAAAPTISNPQPADGTDLSQPDPTLSVDVSDADLGTPQGDNLTVDWYVDGERVHTSSTASNGTVEYTHDESLSGSDHTWHVEVSDKYGETTISQNRTFLVPSTLNVRSESDPQQLFDDATVTIRFYGQENLTVERTTNDGTIDMAGLPTDKSFIAVARAPGTFRRRIFVGSLFQQQSIYLLNESQESVYNVFALSDLSGTYPTGSTRLILQRALNTSDGLEWQTIAGDYFGSTNEFPVNLRYDRRIRMIVENDQGDRRIVGAYHPTDEGNPKTIEISSIVVDPPEGQQYHGTAWLGREDPVPDNNVTERNLRFSYADPQTETASLDLLIHERGNESNVLAEVHQDDVGTEWAYTRTLEGANATEKTWMVDWSAERNGETVGQEIPVGQRGELPLPMDPEWLTRFALVALPIVAALASERIATLGAIGTVVFAGVLMITGIWEIPVLLWFAALIVAIGAHALTMARTGAVFG